MKGFGLDQAQLTALERRMSLATQDIAAIRGQWDGATRDGAEFAVSDTARAHEAFQQHVFDLLRARIRVFDELSTRARDTRTAYALADEAAR
ncbi:hypothetical protein JOF53_003067 [Crossiella equi]|uniref:WXG100 family type VII secretion target n=1 Tax=Crossiella equi TaxID=130796 RepID=A0ABS5AC89_9PSEU|nr:hypothetical protein [Crossiella equi]MBP2474195.1 hypothetical protein [Crossiella equi]